MSRLAIAAAKAHAEGATHGKIGEQDADFVIGGYCARLIRMLHEAALGIGAFDWPYAAANARQMEEKLKAAGLAVDAPEVGSVIAMNLTHAKSGHIGIYLGDQRIAHNTSSRAWGPGTVTTALSRVRSIISGYYNALPAIVVVDPQNRVVLCAPELKVGATWVDANPVRVATGQTPLPSGGRWLLRNVLPIGWSVDWTELVSRGLLRLVKP